MSNETTTKKSSRIISKEVAAEMVAANAAGKAAAKTKPKKSSRITSIAEATTDEARAMGVAESDIALPKNKAALEDALRKSLGVTVGKAKPTVPVTKAKTLKIAPEAAAEMLAANTAGKIAASWANVHVPRPDYMEGATIKAPDEETLFLNSGVRDRQGREVGYALTVWRVKIGRTTRWYSRVYITRDGNGFGAEPMREFVHDTEDDAKADAVKRGLMLIRKITAAAAKTGGVYLTPDQRRAAPKPTFADVREVLESSVDHSAAEAAAAEANEMPEVKAAVAKARAIKPAKTKFRSAMNAAVANMKPAETAPVKTASGKAKPGQGEGYKARKEADMKCLRIAQWAMETLGHGHTVAHFAGFRFVINDKDGQAICDPAWPATIKKLALRMVGFPGF